MSRTDQITKIIRSLSNNTPDVEGAAVIDNDGLMIASALSADLDEDSVGAMGAALLGLGERIVSELERGSFELVMIRGDNGFVILTRCGSEAVLACLASTGAKLGLIFLDLKRSAKELSSLLG
ncbi:MAG: roadblock/LC7 domain-containing protein [Alphaproteobacteria bacterium]|nr:roadblock/LC7 domain-containing protein [Alphaproteobacteria bacterium]